MRNEARVLLREAAPVAAAISVAAALCAMACAAFASMFDVPVVIGLSLSLATLPLVFARSAVRALGARGWIYIGLAPLTFAPGPAIAAIAHLRDPLVRPLALGSQSSALLLAIALATAIAATPLAPLWWLLCRTERPALERWLRRATSVAIALAAGVVLLALRAASARPEPMQWQRSLPVVATITDDDWDRLGEDEHGRRRYRASTAHGALVMKCPWQYSCRISFLAPGAAEPSGALPWGYEMGDLRHPRAYGRYVIRRAPSGFLVLETRYLHEPGYIGASTVFTERGEWRGNVTAADVRDELAPPFAWTVGAGVGVAVAILLCALGAVLGRDNARGWIEGRVRDDGAIVLANGARLAPRDLLPGTSVVARGVTTADETYRSDGFGTAADVIAGTLGGRRQHARSLATGLTAAALSVVVLTVAPLLVSIQLLP